MGNEPLKMLYEIADIERLSLDFIVLIRHKAIDADTKQGGELSEILLGNNHFRIAKHDLCRILRQRVDMLELCQRHLPSAPAQLVHRGPQMPVGGAEAHDEQVGILLVAFHLKVRHRDEGDLFGPQMVHLVVILRLSGDGTRLAVLLQSTEDMLITFLSGDSPVAHFRFRIAMIR